MTDPQPGGRRDERLDHADELDERGRPAREPRGPEAARGRPGDATEQPPDRSLLGRLVKWGVGAIIAVIIAVVLVGLLVWWLLFSAGDGGVVDVEVPSEIEVEPGGVEVEPGG